MDTRMTESIIQNEYKVKICVLSHPKELVSQFTQKLLQKHRDQSSFRNFAALGISISTVNLLKGNNRVNVILLQTAGKELMEKLRLYYSGASGAIILFEKDDPESFEAAKHYYQDFRKLIIDPLVPVIFIDVLESEVFIEEPETLENEPNVLYYEINGENLQAFSKIIDSIIVRYITTHVT